MMHLRFSHDRHSIREKRLLRFAEAAKDAKSAQEDPEKVALKKKVADLEKADAEKTKQIEDRDKQIKEFQDAALEKTKTSVQGPDYTNEKRAESRLAQNDERARSYADASLGKQAYYPTFRYENGQVYANSVPEGALSYYKPGAVVHRIDKVLGRIEFSMNNEGQWDTNGVIQTNQQALENTEALERAAVARRTAENTRSQMLARYLNASRTGQPIPTRANMEADYAQEQYLAGMAKKGGQIDPNYNPNWTSNYKVAGQMNTSPAQVAQRNADRDAFVRSITDPIDQKLAEARAGNMTTQNVQPQNGMDVASNSGPSAYDDVLPTRPTGSPDRTTDSENRTPVSTVSYTRETVAPPQDFAPQKIETFQYNRRMTIPVPGRMGMSGGEDFAVKIQVPPELSGMDEKNSGITYFPREGRFRSAFDQSMAERAGIVMFRRNNNQGVIANLDLYFTKAGKFSVLGQGGSRKTVTFPSTTIDANETQEDTDKKKLEDAKYNDALALLPDGQWGRIPSGNKDIRGNDFAYRISGGVLQAYSPIAGLYQFERVNANWIRTGNRADALDVAYNNSMTEKKAEPIAAAPAPGPSPKSAVENPEEKAKIAMSDSLVELQMQYGAFIGSKSERPTVIMEKIPAFSAALANLSDDDKDQLRNANIYLIDTPIDPSVYERNIRNGFIDISVDGTNPDFASQIKKGLARIKELADGVSAQTPQVPTKSDIPGVPQPKSAVETPQEPAEPEIPVVTSTESSLKINESVAIDGTKEIQLIPGLTIGKTLKLDPNVWDLDHVLGYTTVNGLVNLNPVKPSEKKTVPPDIMNVPKCVAKRSSDTYIILKETEESEDRDSLVQIEIMTDRIEFMVSGEDGLKVINVWKK